MIFDGIKIGVIFILRFLCFYQSNQGVISSEIKFEKSWVAAKICHFFYQWALFVLCLRINVDKLQYNKINSMEGMIFDILN